jgi:lipopolysaccharide export system permease protein
MIFRRAALREFAGTATAIFVALLFILVTVILVRLLSQAAGGRVPADAVLALIGFSTLNHIPVILALSMFIAVLMSITRSYRDSEMVVWFSCGLPLTAWIVPVLQFAVPVMLLIAGLSLFLSPWAQERATEYRKRLDTRDEISQVMPGAFREASSAQRVFFVESIEANGGKVKNVFIAALRPGQQGVTVANEGIVETAKNGDRFAVLLDGRRYEGEPGSAEYRVTRFERYMVRIEPKEIGEIEVTPKITTTQELLEKPTNVNRGELVWRIGLPIASVVLALLAIPLAFVNPRAGRTNNLIFAVLAFTVYFNLLGVSQAWVSKGIVSIGVGFWAVHVVMIVLMLGLFAWRMLPNLRFGR